MRVSDMLVQAFEPLIKIEKFRLERSQMMFKIVNDFVNSKEYDRAFDALLSSSASLGQLGKDAFQHVTGAPITLFNYDGAFGKLGVVDFDKAMFMAQSIKWREFRLAAEISTCRSVLNRRI